MKSIRIAMTMALATATTVSFALPASLGDFQKTYKAPAGSALAKAGCAVCHAGPPKLNPYGQDVKKAMKAMKVQKPTAAVFKKIATLDSDKDGAKNIAEIKAGTLPGDSKSKPAAKPHKAAKRK